MNIKLLITGHTPLWMIAILAVALIASTIYVYRKQHVQRPWSIILPALRIAAFLLLLLTLLRPVLARFKVNVIRGRIPVILDNTGSMSIADEYKDEEKVEVAWNLELFPRKLRATFFRELEDPFQDAQDKLVSAREKAKTLATFKIAPFDKKAARALKHTRKALDKASDSLADLASDIESEVEDYDYLSDASNRSGPDSIYGLNWEVFKGISGTDVKNLIEAEKYPDKPDKKQTVEFFESPRNTADNYGGRLYGYIVPQDSGDYVFFFTSDDGGALHLSTDQFAKNSEKLLGHDGYIPHDEWKLKSDPVSLEAGNYYYVEALLKEGSGGDHLRVGWKRPDGKTEKPVPGDYLRTVSGDDEFLAFKPNYSRWKDSLKRTANRMKKHSETADTMLDEDKTNIARFAEAMLSDVSATTHSWQRIRKGFKDLQSLADRELAEAGIEEVDEALEYVSTTNRWNLLLKTVMDKPHHLLDMLEKKGQTELFLMKDQVEPVKPDVVKKEKPDLSSTRLGSILHSVLTHYENDPVAGIVMFTDGNNNAGKSFQEAREIARERNIPLLIGGVGATRPPHDIAIESVLIPETSFKGDLLNVGVVMHRNGYQDKPFKLKVSSAGETLREVEVEPGPERRLTADASFVEHQDGERNYLVEVEPFDGEALEINNKRTFNVKILEDKIRTLLIDEFPRWETRYLRMMLSRDKRVDSQTIFIASQANATLEVQADAFPTNREEILAHQLIVIGDVNPDHFSTNQIEDIRDFVFERGGTLITMAGEHYMPQAYLNTPLRDLLPFHPTGSDVNFEDDKYRKGGATVIPLTITDDGKHDSIVQIGRTPEMSDQLWNKLPGMNWVRSDMAVAPAADKVVKTENKNVPIMIKAYAGAGKVLYLGSDTFWRWRDRARWRYHHRFWGQVVLWSALGRTTGSDEHVKLMSDRLRYAPGETVRVRARLLDEKELPIEDAQASIEVLNASEEVIKQATLLPIPGSGGEYRAELQDLPRGQFTVRPKVFELRDADIDAKIQFTVGDIAAGEYVHLKLRRPQLEKWATDYRPFYDPVDFVDKIESIDLEEEERRDFELWNNLLLPVLAGILLGLEWHYRKQCRLA
ncbi:MAG: PA14 domain-containing protein [Kiritimatiellia bacterium]